MAHVHPVSTLRMLRLCSINNHAGRVYAHLFAHVFSRILKACTVHINTTDDMPRTVLALRTGVSLRMICCCCC
jgi:hypothetical protein